MRQITQLPLALRARVSPGAEAADNNAAQGSDRSAVSEHWRRGAAGLALHPQLSLFARRPAQPAAAAEEPAATPSGSTGAGRGPPAPTAAGPKSGPPGGAGEGAGAADIARERGPPPPAIVRNLEPHTEKAPSRDFRITGVHRIGQGGPREKALANLEAIRTLKRIEADKREATGAEQAVLARYSGWGALASVFRPYPPQEWQHAARELRALLSEDEYAAARASTPNAHFTSSAVIEAMWQAMRALRTRGRRADSGTLDGGGAFLRTDAGGAAGRQPPHRRRARPRHGADRAAALSRMRPSSPRASRRRRCPTTSSTRWSAISRSAIIPFTTLPTAARRRSRGRSTTTFWRSRSTSCGPAASWRSSPAATRMDKQDAAIRRHLAGQARPDRRDPAAQHRVQGECRDGSDDRHPLPAQTRAGSGGGRRGMVRAGGAGDAGRPDRGQRILRAPSRDDAGRDAAGRHDVQKRRADAYRRALARASGAGGGRAARRYIQERRAGARAAGLFQRAGARQRRRQGRGLCRARRRARHPHRRALRGGKAARFSGGAGARDDGRSAMPSAGSSRRQLEDAPDERIVEARQRLNVLYDSFVQRYGPLSSRENVKAFAGDPDQPLLLSLENYEPETQARREDGHFRAADAGALPAGRAGRDGGRGARRVAQRDAAKSTGRAWSR